MICFGYAAYELLVTVCLLFQGSALQNNSDVVVISRNQQYMHNNYYDPYVNNGYNKNNQNYQTWASEKPSALKRPADEVAKEVAKAGKVPLILEME